MNGDEAWNSHYAKHWYVVATNRIDTEAYAYQPGKDGIPIYQTWDEYQDYDQGISGRKIQLLEIGWNIPATAKAKSLKFEVTMTLVATMLYSDVSKFQWEPVSELNETPIGKVTGTVRFLNGITASNSWAWLHYSGVSTTERGENGELKFAANNVRVGRYLDLVAAFDSSVMHDTSGGKAGQQYTPAGDWIRKRDYDSLAELKQCEKDKETQARAEQRNTVKKWAITLGIGLGISLIALIMAIFGFVRVRLVVRSRDVMYVHDIPQIGPVNVARIVSIMGLAPKHGYDHRQTAATLLSLAAKGAIAIYPGPASLYGGVELTGLAAKTRPLALRAVSQMLSGSGAADLALWDQYLVYATAMGMSKRTLRELAKAYPQIQNPDWLDDNATDSLVYWNFRYASIGDTHDGSSRASTGDGTGLGFGLGPADSDHLGASFGGILDFGAQLGSGFNEISATIRGAAPASASIDGSSGSFSGGGSGGGSFGGR